MDRVWTNRVFFMPTVGVVFGELSDSVPEGIQEGSRADSGNNFSSEALKAAAPFAADQFRAHAAFLADQLSGRGDFLDGRTAGATIFTLT